MNLSTIKAIAVAAAFVASGAGAAAENYFVGPEANVAAGTKITYKNVDFIVGQTAFTGILVSASLRFPLQASHHALAPISSTLGLLMVKEPMVLAEK